VCCDSIIYTRIMVFVFNLTFFFFFNRIILHVFEIPRCTSIISKIWNTILTVLPVTVNVWKGVYDKILKFAVRISIYFNLCLHCRTHDFCYSPIHVVMTVSLTTRLHCTYIHTHWTVVFAISRGKTTATPPRSPAHLNEWALARNAVKLPTMMTASD
jgi:hypothetical protein